MIRSSSVDVFESEIGNYRITNKIGEGGMGIVYAAEHALLGRRAAVKVLLSEFCRNQEIINRFFNEAKAATAIRHPGIVEVYDFGFHRDGRAYIVMEYLDGESLSDRIKRIGPMPVSASLSICSQICGALGSAHARGIVHRDLKPDNIFLVDDADVPGGERAKLLDFGIAKLTQDREAVPVKTRSGLLMGTPTYMSPEQCKGAGHVREASDLYSVGCILYEMLCGQPPFQAEGSGEVIAQHIYRQPVPLRERLPQIGPAIDDLVLRLLAKEPSHRPASAAALRTEIEQQRRSLNDSSGTRMESSPPSTAASSVSMPCQPTLQMDSQVGAAAGVSQAVAGAGRRYKWAAISIVLMLAFGGVALGIWKTSDGLRRRGDANTPSGAEAPGAISRPLSKGVPETGSGRSREGVGRAASPADPTAAALLDVARAAVEGWKWSEAVTAAKAAMAADPGSEAAQDLFDRARMELASEQSYLEFTRAVLNRDYAQVAELFRRLSPASVYRARAQHEHDRLKHDYIKKYDREGKDLAEQGRCQDQERLAVEAAKVWSEARRAIRLHPCKQAATRAAVAAPPPSSDPETLPGASPGRIALQELNEEPATAEGGSGDGSVAAPAAAPAPAFEQLAADARRAAAEGEYTRALELCEAALEKKSDDRGAATTCGVAACRLRNAAKARQFILAVEGSELREQLKRICLLEGVDI